MQNEKHFDFNFADELTKKLGLLLCEVGDPNLKSETDFHKWNSKNSWVEDYAKFVVIRESSTCRSGGNG